MHLQNILQNGVNEDGYCQRQSVLPCSHRVSSGAHNPVRHFLLEILQPQSGAFDPAQLHVYGRPPLDLVGVPMLLSASICSSCSHLVSSGAHNPVRHFLREILQPQSGAFDPAQLHRHQADGYPVQVHPGYRTLSSLNQNGQGPKTTTSRSH